MPVSHTHRCVFVHIPKTGGTSIETALGMFHRWQDENTDAMFGLVQSPALKQHGWTSDFLQHLSYTELASVVPVATLRGYFSFAWVRNPWERLVSVYSNTDPNLLQRAAALGVQLKGLKFADFVAATADIAHVHLQPQHGFIFDAQGRQQVDFVGRFEHFAQDFATVAQRLGLTLALPHRNASQHAAYRELYDSHTRQVVAQRYGADIEQWGYVF